MTTTTTTTTTTTERSPYLWLCEACGDPIDDGDGFLGVDLRPHAERTANQCERRDALGALRVATRALALDDDPEVKRLTASAAVPLLDLTAFTVTRSAYPWHILHWECDATGRFDSYWIAVERLRTDRQALAWTLHLAGREWYGATDWRRIIDAAAGRPDA